MQKAGAFRQPAVGGGKLSKDGSDPEEFWK